MLFSVHAQEMPVPVNIQVSLFGRILSFDRSFENRAGEEIVVGILYQRTFRPSFNAQENVINLFLEPNAFSIKGKSTRVVAIDISGGPNEETKAMLEGVDVLYITPLRAIDISSIVAQTRAKRIRSLTGVPEYVDAGVAVGVSMRGERPEILINLTAAKLEGADFSSQLLKLAKVIQP